MVGVGVYVCVVVCMWCARDRAVRVAYVCVCVRVVTVVHVCECVARALSVCMLLVRVCVNMRAVKECVKLRCSVPVLCAVVSAAKSACVVQPLCK